MLKTVPEKSEIFTDTWQQISWQDLIQLTNQSAYKNGKFYYYRGYMKIEMS